MAVSVSVVVAVATEAYDRPVLSMSYALPVAALSYISLVVDARVDSTGRYKLLRDSSVVLDDAVLSFGKALASSTLGTSDTQTLEFGKALTDSVSFTEVFTALIILVREYADTASVTDSAAITAIKTFGDSTGTTDSYVLTLNKLINDGVAMNDSFDATDGSQFAFTKSVMNIAFVGDTFSLQPGKHLTDNIDTGDTGSLRSQGYADFSYFAEDYVGDSRTF